MKYVLSAILISLSLSNPVFAQQRQTDNTEIKCKHTFFGKKCWVVSKKTKKEHRLPEICSTPLNLEMLVLCREFRKI
jgi:hypothetical protein